MQTHACKIKHTLARVIGFTVALALCVGTLSAVIWVLGTNAWLMDSQFRRYAPETVTGISQESYPYIAQMTTQYLSGDVNDFQLYAGDVPLFNQREQIHMADCQALFALDWKIGLGCYLLALALSFAAWQKRLRPPFFSGMKTGFLTVILLALLLGLGGVFAFDRLFLLFHQLSFSNHLWLLNPAEDLLIRLMPTQFFISYAAIGLAIWLMLLLVFALCAHLMQRKQSKRCLS